MVGAKGSGARVLLLLGAHASGLHHKDTKIHHDHVCVSLRVFVLKKAAIEA